MQVIGTFSDRLTAAEDVGFKAGSGPCICDAPSNTLGPSDDGRGALSGSHIPHTITDPNR
ncbi:hypothetical protein GCM10027570_14050 [Streptomonospora sediminis]